MEPRVTKRDRKLHLSYQIHHRVHCSAIYPISAPNGANVIVYGHERGIRILWRGGTSRRQRRHAGSHSNSTTAHEMITVDGDGEEEQESEDDNYQDEEDEVDPDCPYASIRAEVDIELEAGVLHLAMPSMDPHSMPRSAGLLRSHAVLAVALADGSQRLLTIPLEPPSYVTTKNFKQAVLRSQIELSRRKSTCRAIAMKAIAPTNGEHGAFVVAGASDVLSITRVPFSSKSLLIDGLETKTFQLPPSVTHMSFTSSARSAQLLVASVSGTVQLFDPMPSTTYLDPRRPSSSDSAIDKPSGTTTAGRWLMAFQTSFVPEKAGKARRKHILDAAWLMSGKAIIVLLEDGEWGIWDVAGTSQPGRGTSEFALHGFLGSSGASETAEPSKAQRVVSKLAPMTPNTRKAKAENLFVGAPKIPGVPTKGGISVLHNNARAGLMDESVIMWYGSDVYSITSLQAFWQRCTASSGRGSGSLYSPALTHITDISLMNEAITSISQFASASSSNNSGQMNTQRDLLVSAEHQIIILQNSRPPTPAKGLFSQAAERPMLRDQKMLDAGDLDLGGMDRLLDNMADADARPRRVGFAH